ncbi:hypothetical protein [Butyrivibrio sp. WCD3002]|uniref:hypothetical protein n=1 Tax=Butyrivibrio sp. WCD3002 TaxID=1280676 RepID=UPI0004107D04|nr:hypothetical protein [Butyrivibrio sp. WCD3002]
MKKITFKNGIIITLATMMAMAAMTGCSKNVAEDEGIANEIADEETPLASAEEVVSEVSAAPYFSKGVYVNYAKDAENPPKTYFYVFSDDSYGYTADGENDDIGVPFDITQTDGQVEFSFGGAEESKDVLVITGAENGMVYGCFEDVPDRELVFEPVADADPENFSAVNYLSSMTGGDNVYRDANGWSVHYNPSCITVNQGGPVTTFVYTGDCAGTCMITATYDVDKDAKTAAEDLAASYGDQAMVSDCVFPGTEDVEGFYVDAVPGQTGPGLYASAFVREYMGGYLIFEFTQHVAGDDEMDMAVSDNLSAIIDSLSFE